MNSWYQIRSDLVFLVCFKKNHYKILKCDSVLCIITVHFKEHRKKKKQFVRLMEIHISGFPEREKEGKSDFWDKNIFGHWTNYVQRAWWHFPIRESANIENEMTVEIPISFFFKPSFLFLWFILFSFQFRKKYRISNW